MGDRPLLGDLLVEAGLIDDHQLQNALEQQRELERPLGMTLVRMGLLDEDALVRVLATQLGLPVVRLRGKRVSQEVLDLVPSDLAEKHRCVPLLLNEEDGENVLYLAMEDPARFGAVDEIRARSGQELRPVLVAPTELDEALHRFYHWSSFAGENTAEDSADAGLPKLGTEPELLIGGEPVQLSGARALGPAPPAAGSDESGVPPEKILRALTQLLVEKGLISRDDLVERLRQLEG